MVTTTGETIAFSQPAMPTPPPPPPPASLPKIDKNAFGPKATLTPGVEVEVILTHVEDDGGVFHVFRRDARAFRELLGTFATKTILNVEEVREGDQVFVRDGLDVRRCLVVDGFKLKELDTGKVVSMTSPVLHGLPQELKDLPPLAVKVKLEGAKNKEEVLEKLKGVCDAPEKGFMCRAKEREGDADDQGGPFTVKLLPPLKKQEKKAILSRFRRTGTRGTSVQNHKGQG